MRVPRLGAMPVLALAGMLALAGCKDEGMDNSPAITDGIAETRDATQTELSDKDPSECMVKRTRVEWILVQGRCDVAGLAQGLGKAVGSEGSIYEGGFKDGRFDGHGVYAWLDNKKYVAVGTEKNGDQYIVEFTGRRGLSPALSGLGGLGGLGGENGHSALGWQECKYIGEFKNGTQNGYGIFYFPSAITAGEWENGEAVEWRTVTYVTPNAMYIFATDLEAVYKLEEAKEVYRYITKIAPDSDAAVKAAERLLILF